MRWSNAGPTAFREEDAVMPHLSERMVYAPSVVFSRARSFGDERVLLWRRDVRRLRRLPRDVLQPLHRAWHRPVQKLGCEQVQGRRLHGVLRQGGPLFFAVITTRATSTRRSPHLRTGAWPTGETNRARLLPRVIVARQ